MDEPTGNLIFIYESRLAHGLRALSLDAAGPKLFRLPTDYGVEYVTRRAGVFNFATRNGYHVEYIDAPQREVTVLHGETQAVLREVEVYDVELRPLF